MLDVAVASLPIVYADAESESESESDDGLLLVITYPGVTRYALENGSSGTPPPCGSGVCRATTRLRAFVCHNLELRLLSLRGACSLGQRWMPSSIKVAVAVEVSLDLALCVKSHASVCAPIFSASPVAA